MSRSGDALTSDDICECLRKELMPLCTLVTPNLPEVGPACLYVPL